MKKIIHIILAMSALVFVVAACSGDSYQKRLDKQKKAIRNFLSDNEISVIPYPKDHVFGENEFCEAENSGVYYQVIDPGNLKDTLDSEYQTKVIVRFDSVLHMASGGYEKGNNHNNHWEITFTYNSPGTYSGGTSGGINWTYMSPSIVVPLQKGLGAGAEVNMIIPFNNGSSYQVQAYEPFYFARIKYRFNSHVEETEEPKGEGK